MSLAFAGAFAPPAFAQPAAGGGAFTLVVKSDGSLWAFGLNNNGQLGDNSITTRKSPQPIAGLTNIQKVAAGGVHSMAVTASGALYVWGDSLYGQVGDGFTTDRKTPVLLSSLSNVVAVAAGEFHSLALTSSGDVYAWGRNNFGQIGNGGSTSVNVTSPTVVLTGAVAIGAGRNHSLAVKGDGTAWAWGANGSGQLGNNTTSTGATSLPVQMQGITTASKIAGGEAHSFIILSDGTLKGAGENGAGQLADGTSTDRWTAITIGTLSTVTQVATGLDHAFALLTDGSVYGWGENTGGELGLGANTTDQRAPVQVMSLTGISAMATGWSHSISVDSNGVVSTWGVNASSQLGDGTTLPRSVPTPISESGYAWRVATPVFNPASGTFTADKSVVVTVDTLGAEIHYTQNGADPTESDPIVQNGSITVTYTQTLKAKAWKLGMPAGEVASATIEMKVATPTVSPTATTYTTPQNVTFSTTTPGATLRYTTDGSDPTESSTEYLGAINVGHTTSFRIAGFKSGWTTSAIRAATYTMNFGTLSAPVIDPPSGTYTGSVTMTTSTTAPGEVHYTTALGTATPATPTATSPSASPLPIKQTTNVRARSFHPDYLPSVGEVTRTYTIIAPTPTLSAASGSYAPGSTVTITAGDPTLDTLRITLDGSEPTTAHPIIASGTAILLGDYTLKVKAWRDNATDSAVASASYTLTAPLGPGSAAGGGAHSLLVTPDGRVLAWGEGSDGQLGHDSTADRRVPTQLNTIAGVTSVAAGGGHSMALTATGALYVWGDGFYGQVGDGFTIDRKTPVLLPSLSSVTAIAAGEFHSLALTSSGDVYAWGRNNFGQIGNGGSSSVNVTSPTVVLTGAVAIGAGRNHSLAVKGDGSAWSWGANGSGQLGNNTTSAGATSLPVQMQGITTASKIAGGEAHSFIIMSDGTLKGAGENGAGQLADGTSTDRWTAITIGTLSNVTQVTSGLDHAFALLTDGSVYGWGENTGGELGLGANTTDQRSVVQVTSLSGISTMATGWSHSMSVGSNGVVSTWGFNASGQLGDGTTYPRSVPTPISDTGYAWRVATPVFNPSSGTFTADKPVVVMVDTAEAEIHYTQNGADPTESDPTVAPSGSITVTYSQTLKAKAWKSGMPASEVAIATIEMKVATPTVTPTATTYTTPQDVTMSTTTPGVTLRYTTDGTDPTESSTAYTGAINVAHTTTFRIAGFKSGWTPSTVRVSTYTMNFGTLAAPVIDPPSGTYTGSVTMMASTTDAGVVHYTTAVGTGTPATPTINSPSDSPAVPFKQTTSVRARSFHPDYTPSVGEVTRTYTIIADTPMLSAASGSYAPGSTVTITAGEPALDTLRMTIDGTEPTSTSRTIASGTSIFLGNFTLKVRAFRANATQSAVASADYILNAPLGPGAVAAGGAHTSISTPDGRVYAWGDNIYGQVGNNTITTDVLSPVLLNTITGVTAIAGGLQHTLAVTWDGRVHAWGSNESGRLGNGTSTGQMLVPYSITTLSNVIAVAAGDTHSLALTSDGRVFAWGGNTAGQLGLGNTSPVSVPTEIPGLSNIVAIAAGDHNSFAITSSGQLYGWGSNGSSSLGLPSNVSSSPFPVLIDLPEVAAIAPGFSFMLAMTKSGDVYGWGASGSGQVGQFYATITQPTQVVGLKAIAITAGDSHAGAIRHDGILVAWGENFYGQVGNNAAPTDISVPTPVVGLGSVSTVKFGDDHSVAVTSSGDVYTWGKGADGRLGSGSTTDRYTAQTSLTGLPLWPPAQPVIDPPGGSYETLQTVTITASDPSATIRYTLDGSTPSESSALYSGSFEVNSTTTIKARAYLSNGAPPSAVTTSVLTFVSGTLSTPIASPTGGIRQSVQVTLTADEGATIRYTLNGLNPTASSPVYSEPISITSGVVTLKAKAFKAGWVDSTVMSHTYTIDNVPPTHVASLSPSPLNGWNNTPVTIQFHCLDNVGVADCPTPVTVTAEGAAQDIMRVATDFAGNQTAAGSVLNVDRTPPLVVLTSPSEAFVTTETSVTLVAAVSDAVSGVATVTCNGSAATVTNGQVSCVVPLRKGVNSLVVMAQDAARNSGSMGVRVTRVGTPTALVLAPTTRTTLIGSEFSMSLRDDFGALVEAAAWQTSDPNVVGLSTSDPPLLVGVGAGSATITATKDGLSATATITVLAGEALPDGTATWSLQDLGAEPISVAMPDPNGPATFTSELEAGEWQVHAVSADGRHLRTEAAPGQVMMADHAGGLVAFTGQSSGLARFAGPDDAPPWRHQATGSLLTLPSQAPDGTIYVIDHQPATSPRGAAINDAVVLVIDGNSGALKYRYVLPRSRFVYDSISPDALQNGCTQPPEEYGVSYSAPVIGSDGRAYVTVAPHDVHVNRRWINNACVDSFVEYQHRIKLITLSSTGTVTTLDVLTETNNACSQVAIPKQVLTDGGSGIVITTITNSQCSAYEMDDVAYKTVVVNSAGAVATFQSTPGYSIAMTSGTGTAYLVPTTGGNVVAKDIATWTTKFTAPVAGTALMPLADDGLVIHDSGGLVFVDGNGSIINTAALILQEIRIAGPGFYQGTNGTTGAVEFVVSSMVPVEADSYFGWPLGNPFYQRRNATACTVPTDETVESLGWLTDQNSIHQFKQTLMSAGGNVSFAGRKVTERPWYAGVDTCHFQGSAFEPVTRVSGGTWEVASDNTWGIDFVGWRADVAFYYQEQRVLRQLPLPCEASTPQEMVISCERRPLPMYKRWELRTIIDRTRIGVQKGSLLIWQNWP